MTWIIGAKEPWSQSAQLLKQPQLCSHCLLVTKTLLPLPKFPSVVSSKATFLNQPQCNGIQAPSPVESTTSLQFCLAPTTILTAACSPSPSASGNLSHSSAMSTMQPPTPELTK
uniref:Uncharacterized protein n=1 Tax=Micrurus spixii TaxID=129469 RepID=A0A2D4LER0_9SAUR